MCCASEPCYRSKILDRRRRLYSKSDACVAASAANASDPIRLASDGRFRATLVQPPARTLKRSLCALQMNHQQDHLKRNVCSRTELSAQVSCPLFQEQLYFRVHRTVPSLGTPTTTMLFEFRSRELPKKKHSRECVLGRRRSSAKPTLLGFTAALGKPLVEALKFPRSDVGRQNWL